ncbi:MAG TPA: nucleotidyltransferase family protein [Terriglobales bacterium]|nr:nucleotidyltransferase family protein [Terriglobales bacterium]
MARAPSLCGVILAAGESSRMGTDKALLPWPPGQTEHTFLSAAIRLLNAFNDLVIVVAGNNEESIAPAVYATSALLVRNPAPERGQLSSLQVGLEEVLNQGRDAATIALVDRPPVAAATLKTLMAAFESALAQEKWAVIPEYQGKHGHPILADREMIEAFLKAPASSSAREVEHANEEHIQYVAVDDPNVAVNVNTPEDYAALAPKAAP